MGLSNSAYPDQTTLQELSEQDLHRLLWLICKNIKNKYNRKDKFTFFKKSMMFFFILNANTCCETH